MYDELAIKNKKPNPRQMLADYAMMFSGFNLKFILVLLGLMGVALLIFIYGPSPITPTTNIIPRVLAAINAYFLFCGSAMLCFSLASPLIARLILPSAIATLELVRLILFALQGLIDDLLIRPITQSFLYPKAESNEPNNDA
jgi:hypothetical protein